KVTRERNLGLSKRAKSLGLLAVAVGFAVVSVVETPVHTTLSFTRFNVPGVELGTVGWCVLAVGMILATSNAVNLTDGLEGLAALALTTSTEVLLAIIGGLFVFETLSVIIQVGAFRIFGRRVFRMAPIHHHFELAGWPENTAIVRFWILAGLFTALGLGFY